MEGYVRKFIPNNQLDNIMVRMLAGVADSQSLYYKPVVEYIKSEPALMLALAKRHLLTFTFFGLMVIQHPLILTMPNNRFLNSLRKTLTNPSN